MPERRKLTRKDPFEEFRTRKKVLQKEAEFRRRSGKQSPTTDITRRILRQQERARAVREETRRRGRRPDTRTRTRRRESGDEIPPPFPVEEHFNT